MLLLASYFFYSCWNVKYLILIIFSTIATYISGLLMVKYKKYKKIILITCITINLFILFYFKYFNWIISLYNLIVENIDVSYLVEPIDVLLPVGISFYTFQAFSYILDVYYEKIDVESDFITYALFVSFFPQLVAGPIERSKNLITELHKMQNEKLLSSINIERGIVLIV